MKEDGAICVLPQWGNQPIDPLVVNSFLEQDGPISCFIFLCAGADAAQVALLEQTAKSINRNRSRIRVVSAPAAPFSHLLQVIPIPDRKLVVLFDSQTTALSCRAGTLYSAWSSMQKPTIALGSEPLTIPTGLGGMTIISHTIVHPHAEQIAAVAPCYPACGSNLAVTSEVFRRVPASIDSPELLAASLLASALLHEGYVHVPTALIEQTKVPDASPAHRRILSRLLSAQIECCELIDSAHSSRAEVLRTRLEALISKTHD